MQVINLSSLSNSLDAKIAKHTKRQIIHFAKLNLRKVGTYTFVAEQSILDQLSDGNLWKDFHMRRYGIIILDFRSEF